MILSANFFLTKLEQAEIVNAIKKAELNTSGEIRVHIDKKCKGNVLDAATNIFEKLKMHKTALRNGVLIYIVVEHRMFAIIGDAGINAIVPENFWEEAKNIMAEKFKKAEFKQGVIEGINLIGEKLKQYFPHQEGDINELSDDLSFGK